MKVRYAVRVFAIKDDKIMCIRYKDINKDFLTFLVEKLKMANRKYKHAKENLKKKLG